MNPTESSLSSVASVVSACISSLSLRGRGRRAVEVKPKDADGDGEAAAVGELATPRRYAHGEEAHGRTSSRRVTVRVPTPENFLLTVDDGSPRQPLRLKPMKCEALVGKRGPESKITARRGRVGHDRRSRERRATMKRFGQRCLSRRADSLGVKRIPFATPPSVLPGLARPAPPADQNFKRSRFDPTRRGAGPILRARTGFRSQRRRRPSLVSDDPPQPRGTAASGVRRDPEPR